MSFLGKLKQCYGKLLIAGTVCGLAVFAAGVHADDKKQMVVTPFQDAKLDPARPDGPQIAVLWGDAANGPRLCCSNSRSLEAAFTFILRTTTSRCFRER
jgi:hypothetical protein